jgi:hypothetical protein
VGRLVPVEVGVDLVQAQIIALDVLRGQALNPGSRIARQLALAGRIVQTRDERRERVVDRLRRQRSSAASPASQDSTVRVGSFVSLIDLSDASRWRPWTS